MFPSGGQEFVDEVRIAAATGGAAAGASGGGDGVGKVKVTSTLVIKAVEPKKIRRFP